MRGAALEDGECGFLYPRPYLPLLLLFYLPPFVLTVDWNRWIAAMYYGICLTQLVLCAEGDRHAGRAMEKLSERVRKAPAAYVGALLWLAMLSPLTARFYIPEANAVLRLLRSVF